MGKLFLEQGGKKRNGKMPIQINHYVNRSYNEYFEKIKRFSNKDGFNYKINGFFESEKKSDEPDYSIYKYLIKLKLEMSKN